MDASRELAIEIWPFDFEFFTGGLGRVSHSSLALYYLEQPYTRKYNHLCQFELDLPISDEVEHKDQESYLCSVTFNGLYRGDSVVLAVVPHSRDMSDKKRREGQNGPASGYMRLFPIQAAPGSTQSQLPGVR